MIMARVGASGERRCADETVHARVGIMDGGLVTSPLHFRRLLECKPRVQFVSINVRISVFIFFKEQIFMHEIRMREQEHRLAAFLRAHKLLSLAERSPATVAQFTKRLLVLPRAGRVQ
jgi:hypothetical protein